jgi:histidinol dehydrogenase
VGVYIPGGTAPLFSSVLMMGIPAMIAGCKNIILCTPPGEDGSIHPAILFAASLCGIRLIFKTGGAQAIAAMAYGTESIPACSKIFGPGNRYVTLAKQLVQLDGVAIDMPAGPSEVCVLADESANAGFVASDLLSQAEHGTDSQVMLITTSEQIARQVDMALRDQIKLISRKETASEVLKNSKTIVVSDIGEMMDIANEYAPEHLIIACRNDEQLAEHVVNAGSVFLGHLTPESAGDYASGTNHVLPTNGFARAYSGLNVDSFCRKVTFQKLSEAGINSLGKTVIEMALAEGLDAHALAVKVRLETLNTSYGD